jgi:tetratricopeptide (TPR) repeat protein
MKTIKKLFIVLLQIYIVGCASSLELPQYNSALVAYDEAKYQTALTYIDQALELRNDEPQFYVLRAKANYKIGNKSSAMEDLNKSIELAHNFEAFHLRGKLFLERSELENAGFDLRRAYNLNPQSADLLFDIGYLEFLNGDTQQALNYYTTAVKYDSRNPKTYVNIGNIYSTLGNSKVAIDYYSKALVLDTTDGIAFYNRANEKMILNDLQGAIEDYNYSLKIDSLNTSTLFMLAEANNKVGDIKNSLIQYNSIIKLDSTEAKAYYLRGIVEVTYEEYDKACKDFKKSGELGYFDSYEMIKKYCDKKFLNKKKKGNTKSKR